MGDSVRRPLSAGSNFVHALLLHLEAKEFAGAPRFLGLDENGREVLSFLRGKVPAELGPFSEAQCAAAAKLLRALHDATMDFKLRGRGEVACHGDPSPCNCVFVDDLPRGFIDFDAAHPGTREEDLGYAAWLWLDIGSEDLDPEDQGRRLSNFLSAYDSRLRWEPVEPVILAQRRLSASMDAPPGTREWARACLTWTTQNRERIQSGAAACAKFSL